MPQDSTSPPTAVTPAADAIRRRWSLERRLPLLIFLLVAVVVAALGWAAYREVRTGAEERAAEHLERAVRELSLTVERGSLPRVAALRALAADGAVVASLAAARTEPGAPDVARPAPAAGSPEALAARRRIAAPAADTTVLGRELWTASGVRVAQVGAPAARGDSLALAPALARAAATDSVQRSTLYAAGGRVHHWTVLPILRDGRTIGLLAERRRIVGSTRTERTLAGLIGADVRLHLTNVSGGDWATVLGDPVAAPFTDLPADDSAVVVSTPSGERRLAAQSRVQGAPWRIVLSQSEASVLRRPREFLRALLGLGLAGLGLVVLGVWLVSRHVTRPLRRITDAATALGAGDFDRRVRVEGDAELAGLAAAFNAMSERLGQAHVALAERNAQLQRANEAKARFLAVMSHELRTPLNAIGGYTELLELGIRGPVTAEQREDLARIRRSKDHLLALIEDVLAVTRADVGRLRLSLGSVPVGRVISDAVDALGPQFAHKGIRLDVDEVPESHVVRADPVRVAQIVLNLLSNALRFTPSGGEVAVRSELLDDTVRIDVRDTGIGIARERLEEIFVPFVQVDASLTREVGGVGLGLAISRDLAHAMGGTLTAASEVGRGSTFSLSLPQPRAAESGARAVGAAEARI